MVVFRLYYVADGNMYANYYICSLNNGSIMDANGSKCTF